MRSVTGQVQGWCPCVWTPMESGDGLIVRIHPRRSAMSAGDARDLAEVAGAYGNGHIEVTRRGNIQLRGAAAHSLPSLQRKLVACGLADPTPERENRRRSLLVSPMSGLTQEPVTLQRTVEDIERMLLSEQAPTDLAPKFCIVVDGADGILSSIAADIRVEPDGTDTAQLMVDDGTGGRHTVGRCQVVNVARVVLRLMTVLGEFAAGRSGRMRDLVMARGVGALRASVDSLLVDTMDRGIPSPAIHPLIGFRTGMGRSWFGLGIPLGAANASQWTTLATMADTFGEGEIRVTPRRIVLLPGVAPKSARTLAAKARDAGFVVEEGDPLLRVTACSGSPACGAAFGETRAFARSLARIITPLLNANATLHVSGCRKSCAWSGRADVTVVHAAEGCTVGFAMDAAQSSQSAGMSIEAARHRLADVAVKYGSAAGGMTASAFLDGYGKHSGLAAAPAKGL